MQISTLNMWPLSRMCWKIAGQRPPLFWMPGQRHAFMQKRQNHAPVSPVVTFPARASLPYDLLVEGGSLKPAHELQKLFTARGIQPDSALMTSCGSGISAAVIFLALHEAGYGLNRLYTVPGLSGARRMGCLSRHRKNNQNFKPFFIPSGVGSTPAYLNALNNRSHPWII